MNIFHSFRSVLLISLFLCGMSSTVMAESVADLESALKNCQDSWRRMADRYQQQCGQISEVTRHANETKARLDTAEMPLSLRRKHAQCMDIDVECIRLVNRWNEM